MLENNFTGVLLAGGKSVRFGSPKAFATYQGKSFYRISLEALKPVVNSMIIVSHEELLEEFRLRESTTIVTDDPPFEGCGPLAGIRTAMMKVKSTWYITVPCDTPLVTSELFHILKSNLTEEIDALIPVVKERKQPLIAIYHKRCLPLIDQLLSEQKYKVNFLLKACRTSYLELSSYDSLFTNVNQRENLHDLDNK